MINADEHKKLLAQIDALEKNSVNYFDVEKEFFLIDSENLSQVRPRLYGYSIQRSGIYEEDNLTPEAIAGLDGRGCYVYVDVRDGKITIKQDVNGCWGIYLFRHGDYFALSNSFFRLLDHVKFKYPLTVNRDYCHYFLANDLCSHSYLQTAVNEINLIDRSAILTINILEKNLQSELIDYKEDTVLLDSEKGIATLDNWIEFWSDVFRNIAQHTNFISADLSGGFDTRISIIPMLYADLDLNKVRLNSIKGEVHTFSEDYAIASQIAEHYGLKLNQPLPANKFLNFSFTDIFNIDAYTLQSFHKSSIVSSTTKRVYKLYFLCGLSDGMRGYWHESPKQFIENHRRIVNPYSHSLSNELLDSIETILESNFQIVRNKRKIKDANSKYIPQYMYQETRCRHHYGKNSFVNCYYRNTFPLSPTLDPDLRTLQINTVECPDPQLLIALIFTRYAPDLLKFPFDSNRSIAPETIEYAKKINERFPLVKKDKTSISGGGIFHLQPRDTQAEKILALGRNNPAIPGGLPQACLKATFESSKTYGLFTSHFDEELYHYAASYYDTHVFGRDRPMYGIVGVAKVLEDVEISQRNYPPYQDMKRFLEQDFVTIHNDSNAVLDKFKNYLSARLDIKLMKTTGDFQILDISDHKASLCKPGWLQKGGIGYQIQSYAGKLEIVAKATVDGPVNLNLMGLDIRDPKEYSKRIPYWVDYTKLTVNGKVVLDKLTPAWHDKRYYYTVNAKAGEEIKVQMEWLPHRDDVIDKVDVPPLKLPSRLQSRL